MDPASDRLLRELWQAMLRHVRGAAARGGVVVIEVDVAPGGVVTSRSHVRPPPEYPCARKSLTNRGDRETLDGT